MDAALVVLDGWGLGEHDGKNAVETANTPVFDRLRDRGASGRLEVAGRRVGLPDGQMGNSEVGHLNIGAGRVVYQEYTRIEDAIADGSFRENDAIDTAFDHAEENDGRVHFLGLVSDGGVHSDHEHLHALIGMAAERDLEAVTHAFTDGRDTSPTGGAEYLADLEDVIAEAGTGHVATVTGRYYAMDRDENWERTKRAYDAIVDREGDHTAASAVGAVEDSYDRGVTDEFVEPTVVESEALRASESERRSREQDRPALEDGDSVIWFNFRSDRARQLTRMLADIRPEWDFETEPPETAVVMMTQYDRTFDLPVAFPPNQPENTFGEVLAAAGKTQLRIAESEKYAHVTYFLNGGREVEFDGEIREIVESPDVPTYDERPEMSAPAVTDTAIEIVADGTRPEGASRNGKRGETTHERTVAPDVLVLNYANPDMVGHTGDYEAAIEAVEAVDAELGRLLEVLEGHGAHVFVTADHGNADDMGTEEDPHTAHTYNDVPFVYVAPDGTDGEKTVRDGGTLADIAPTVLESIGLETPAEMTGERLLE